MLPTFYFLVDHKGSYFYHIVIFWIYFSFFATIVFFFYSSFVYQYKCSIK